MQALKLIIKPLSAFGTPLVGDTLFGQICWGIVERYGEESLNACLQDYCAGNPFLVVSDAFPSGYFPLPSLPSVYWRQGDESDRKKLKKRQWLAESELHTDSRDWQQHAKSSADIHPNLQKNTTQPHNSINRATGTTGDEHFAPYSSEQIWYTSENKWQIIFLLDESRLSKVQLRTVLDDIGLSGYGRDASIGLGKYKVCSLEATDLLEHQGNACLTLAPCCPQNQRFDKKHSYYNTLTRFGRHGNRQVLSANPFKHPVLMAQTGAVFCGEREGKAYIGQGINQVSTTLKQTVHQGYAPVIAFNLSIAAFDEAYGETA